MIKTILTALALLSAACTPIIPSPPVLASPTGTVIVEFPNYTATAAPVLRPHPIMSSDMGDAGAFFLMLKIRVMAGDDVGFAEDVHYPIQTVLDGHMTTFSEASELAKNLRAILTDKVMKALTETSEDDLIASPDGIRVANGELWFNLFCVDAACTQTKFLITQINN